MDEQILREMEEAEPTEVGAEIKTTGEWSSLRKHFLMNVKPKYWEELVESGEAESYLAKIQADYQERFEKIYLQLLKDRNCREDNPMEMDWMTWVQTKTQCWEQAREILRNQIQS